MRRWLAVLGLVLMCFGIAGCGATLSDIPKDESPYLGKLGNQTVALVYRYDNGTVATFCTAVWVGDNAILTAAHCVDGVVERMNQDIAERNHRTKLHNDMVDKEEDKWPLEKKMIPVGAPVHFVLENEVTSPFHEPTAWHLAHVSVMDNKFDLALLHADGAAIPPHAYAELANQPPAIGEQVEVVGHQRGLYWSYTHGTVSAYRTTMPIKLTGPWMQVQAPVFFGNSGGGCFDKDGKLIGIASFIAPAPQASFFVHLRNLRLFLDAHLIQH